MARKKPYDDGCATAHALELIGERWALLIVRELVPGPKRFTDLRAALPGISTNILATRLVELEAGHVLRRRRLAPPAATQVYALSDWGADLEPLIRELGRWAARSPDLIPGKPMSAASVMLSMRTMFSAGHADDLDATLSLILGGIPHRARVQDQAFEIHMADAPTADADVTVDGDPSLFAAILYAAMPLAEAARKGLRITGDRAVLQRFRRCFPLPETAEATAPGPDRFPAT